MTMRPRDVVLSIRHEEGKPFHVKLHHKPTRIEAECEADTYDEAKAQAEKDLETLIEVSGAAAC